MLERRAFSVDEEKFSTQRVVTYFLLVLFSGVTVAVFLGSDQAERSTILQTVINFSLIAVGFWLGSSKGASENAALLRRPPVEPPVAAAPPDQVKEPLP